MKTKQRLDSGGLGPEAPLAQVFAALFGGFLGLALIKFGNPPIFERWVTAPTNAYELVLDSPWPIAWAYGLLAAIAVLGVFVARRPMLPFWVILLPLGWLVWEVIASIFTVDPLLTRPTLAHLCACAACFYLGLFCLAPDQRMRRIWPGLFCGLLIVIAVGWEQHFGGLEQTRQYFFVYIYPNLKQVPPEYLKKIASTRIFSTLFYPNALAGAMLLLLPASLQIIWERHDRFTTGARVLLMSALGVTGLACLFWSGSKGGWLLMLVLGLLWLLRLPLSFTVKRNLVISIVALGLAGFFLRYAGFFEKGATSVSARFDYWEAAFRTVLAHPLTGTGPGTFSVAYQRVKRPESEMSRLVHNDYLEQASDSGVPGFLLYSAFIGFSVVLGFPCGSRPAPSPGPELTEKSARLDSQCQVHNPDSLVRFALWLGILGWALQGFLEFGLYIPGLAWSTFAFLGFLLGQRSLKPPSQAAGRRMPKP